MSAQSCLPENFFWLALQRLPGVGPKRYRQLLQRFSSPEQVFAANNSQLSPFGLSAQCLKQLRLLGLNNSDSDLGVQVLRDLQWLAENDCHIVTCNNPLYPVLLAEISSAPPLLYVMGDPKFLNHPQIGMVGSRSATASGRDTARGFAQSLAVSGLTITSGMALGIDAASHEGALQAGGTTIAVLGTGLDLTYPRRHQALAKAIASSGALVTEFPLGSGPRREHFPRRNRLISGLSMGVLVVEAAQKSGSLITANFALEQCREVFAIPGSIHNPQSRGCHALLRNGAKLVESVTDIFDEIGSLYQAQLQLVPGQQSGLAANKLSALDPEIEAILKCIGFEPTAVDAVMARCNLGVGTVSAGLIDLELEGYIECTMGGYQRVGERTLQQGLELTHEVDTEPADD